MRMYEHETVIDLPVELITESLEPEQSLTSEIDALREGKMPAMRPPSSSETAAAVSCLCSNCIEVKPAGNTTCYIFRYGTLLEQSCFDSCTTCGGVDLIEPGYAISQHAA